MYIRQKADQAFDELLTAAPLNERLNLARSHLIFVCGDHFYKSAPAPVVAALKEVWDITSDATWPDTAQKIRTAITEIIKAGVVDDVDPKPWQH